MGQIKALFPLWDAEKIWLGFDLAGLHRRFFRIVKKELVDSDHIVAEQAIG
jgi:hypothetical protein